MILSEPRVQPEELERRTGWAIKPEGACKGDLCVPLPDPGADVLDPEVLADRLGMPLVHDEAHDLWCLGPATVAGRTLESAEAPDLELPDRSGEPFALRSLRGQKVFLLAWASW